jgi:cytidyltransferase-like protein
MAALLIGRYQPLHEGHVALIREAIKRFGHVVIGLRDTEIGEDNPYTVKERREMFHAMFVDEVADGTLKVIGLKGDILHVVHGRKVGWEVVQIDLDKEIEKISATEIRSSASSDSSSEGWKG